MRKKSVIWDNPKVTFWQAVDSIRRDLGMSRKGFVKRFPRVLAVFDREKRDLAERAKARAEMAAARN